MKKELILYLLPDFLQPQLPLVAICGDVHRGGLIGEGEVHTKISPGGKAAFLLRRFEIAIADIIDGSRFLPSLEQVL